MRPSSMRASSSAMRSGSNTPRWWRSPAACWHQTEADAIAALAARRLAHEPIARILGYKEFWGLPLQAQRRHAAAAAGNRDRGRGGVGCSRRRASQRARAAHRRSRHRLGRAAAGTALGAAERVRDRHGYQRHRARLRARQCRRARPCRPCVVRGVRLRGSASTGRSMLSSPIRPTWRARRSPTCSPRCATTIRCRALDGGPDGLDGYREIAAHARRLLAPNGVLAVELGRGQLGAVTAIFAARRACADGRRGTILRASPGRSFCGQRP